MIVDVVVVVVTLVCVGVGDGSVDDRSCCGCWLMMWFSRVCDRPKGWQKD